MLRQRVVAVAMALALAGCGGAASHAARPAQPVFDASGPDAAYYGAGPIARTPTSPSWPARSTGSPRSAIR